MVWHLLEEGGSLTKARDPEEQEMSNSAIFPDNRDFFAANPVLWAAWLTTSQLFQKLKNSLWATLFRAPELYLGPGSLVRGAKHISFGRGVYARRDLWLEAVTRYGEQKLDPVLEIGDGVVFCDGVHVSCVQKISIKRHALIGSHVYISDGSHGLYKNREQSLPHEPPALRKLAGAGPVIIGENACVGSNTVILGPVRIGDAAVIGPNSVIRHDVPPRTIVAGMPAVPLKVFREPTRSWEEYDARD